MKPLTDTEINERYSTILKRPKYVTQLNEYELQEVLGYAEKQKQQAVKLIVEIMEYNPEQFKNETIKSWGIKHVSDYQEAVKVIQAVSNHLKQKNEPEQQKLTGFYTGFNDRQLERLYNYFTKEVFFIHFETKYEHFKAAFKEYYLPEDYTPIKRTGKFTQRF